MSRRLVVIILALAGIALAINLSLRVRVNRAARSVPTDLSDQEYWEMVTRFSEPGRPFRSTGAIRADNLISNERGFQSVMPGLAHVARRGAYLGVGPEQNFTYIAALQPTIAFIIDIRRENMLLHLMHKALVEMSADRVEYLSRLFSRPRPNGVAAGSPIGALLKGFASTTPSDPAAQANRRSILDRLERLHGFALSRDDEESIEKALESFAHDGPALRWDSSGAEWIPSFAELMDETDPEGHPRSYLASEANFQTLRRYEISNRIVPLVGDFSGSTTLRAVGRYLKDHDQIVAAFYTSNVEAYLNRDGATRKFYANVDGLPIDDHSTFIRTSFFTVGYSQAGPDYQTSTMLIPIRARRRPLGF